jgi:hypothetical protein
MKYIPSALPYAATIAARQKLKPYLRNRGVELVFTKGDKPKIANMRDGIITINERALPDYLGVFYAVHLYGHFVQMLKRDNDGVTPGVGLGGGLPMPIRSLKLPRGAYQHLYESEMTVHRISAGVIKDIYSGDKTALTLYGTFAVADTDFFRQRLFKLTAKLTVQERLTKLVKSMRLQRKPIQPLPTVPQRKRRFNGGKLPVVIVQ